MVELLLRAGVNQAIDHIFAHQQEATWKSPHKRIKIKPEATFKNTIIVFICPPKACINIVSILSWDLQWSQEKIKAMLMQNFGGQTKCIMVFLKLAYWLISLRGIKLVCSNRTRKVIWVLFTGHARGIGYRRKPLHFQHFFHLKLLLQCHLYHVRRRQI